MSEHEREPAQRDPLSIAFEANYWQSILSDLDALNHALAGAARELASIPIELLPLIFYPGGEAVLDRVRPMTRDGLAQLQAAQDSLLHVLELAGGRAAAMHREAGLEP